MKHSIALPPRELDVNEASWLANQLVSWYMANGRTLPWRADGISPYVVLLAEIFLQQTPTNRVAQHLPFFLSRFPDLDSIACASIDKVSAALTQLGLQQRRAEVLVSLAQQLVGVDLTQLSKADWMSLPGIGQYRAAAMLSTLHGQPEPMLDVNAARIFDRYAGPRSVVDIRRDRWLDRSMRRVLENGPPRLINWAIMDLGALVCTARVPQCEICPLKSRCRLSSTLASGSA